jgi:hypothetical protein
VLFRPRFHLDRVLSALQWLLRDRYRRRAGVLEQRTG